MSLAIEVVSVLANLIIACTAMYAIFYTRRQIALGRETSIREAYEHYHEVLLIHPHLITGDLPFETLPKKEFRQYETLVLYTLMIGERVFELFPDNEGWHNSIRDDIRLHKRFIASDMFADCLNGMDWKTMRFIREVLAEPDGA